MQGSGGIHPPPRWRRLGCGPPVMISVATEAGKSLLARARDYAISAHQRIDHRRKYTHQPYEEHLRAVAELVDGVTDDAEMLAAAWLHDIVEDTPVTLDEVQRTFGHAVAELVRELTDTSRPGDGNRATRKAIDRGHLAAASARAKTIKLADLCNNARDIADADPRFARVFLAEMAALLEVLGEGEARLLERARRVHAECLARIRVDPSTSGRPGHPDSDVDSEVQAQQRRAVWRQMNTFSVRDLARPLLSVDAGQPVAEALAIMDLRGQSILGVRSQGRVSGFISRRDLEDRNSGETCGGQMHAIDAIQCLDAGASLGAMVHVLTRHDFAFVRLFGELVGVLTREDLHQPIGRMWLFGMVTLMDLMFSQRIGQYWPGGAWQTHLSAGRLDKARQLQAERLRRGQTVELLDCLQFSDKGAILLEHPGLLAEWGFRSKRAAEIHLRDLESLRNHLAHSQDVASQHWHQIARMSRRFDEGLQDASPHPSTPSGKISQGAF
jgi:CBS domain-containing protein